MNGKSLESTLKLILKLIWFTTLSVFKTELEAETWFLKLISHSV